MEGKTKDFHSAIRSLEKAIELHSYDSKPYNNLGYTFYILKDIDKSRKYYKWSLMINPYQKFTLKDILQLDSNTKIYLPSLQRNGIEMSKDTSKLLVPIKVPN